MNLLLIRDPSTETTTTGTLFVNGMQFCYTLEDKVRDKKIAGQTAIPTGKYQVLITWSPRFKRQLPLLINVPGFDGIRIHPGNTHKDTEGCILVGEYLKGEMVMSSRHAFDRLYAVLVKEKDIWIEIK